MKCYPTVSDIPGEVDLAIFTVPAHAILDAIDDCAAKGVRAAIVISAGFRELGGEGASLENEMVERAEEAGMVLVGPNGQGVACPRNRLYPWMPLFYPPEGPIGFVCQSGNILNMMIGHTLEAGCGVSKAVSSGNEAMMKTEDYYSYLAQDPDTEVILSYVEGVEDGRRFLDVSREVSRRKPIVLLKGGRTPSGVSAAKSHTGAMAVGGRLFSDACAQAGITVADSIENAGLIAASFAGRPTPLGNRVGIITGGGGLGVVAADACVEKGLEVTGISDETLDAVAEYLPDYWVPGNPIDLVAGLDLTVVKPILETVMRSGEVDSVLLIFVEAPRSKGMSTRELGGRGYDLSELWNAATSQLLVYLKELDKVMWDEGMPLFIASNFAEFLGDEESDREARTTSMFPEVEAACEAIAAMVRYGEFRSALSQ